MILLFGGESTVKFPMSFQDSKGGRNQELILAALSKLKSQNKLLANKKLKNFALLSIGTDGQDGPTDAAGAFLTQKDLNLKDLDIKEINEYLNTKNSYKFWTKFNNGKNLIKIGKTGTNLMDIIILYIEM